MIPRLTEFAQASLEVLKNIIHKTDNKKFQSILKYINTDSTFNFPITEQPTVEDFEKVIGEDVTLVAKAVFNTPENLPKSKAKEFYNPIKNKNYSGKKIDYTIIDKLAKKGSLHSKNNQYLYALAYDKHIVKLGMTECSIEERLNSYNCGTLRAREKGTCSITNFVVTECNCLALSLDMEVEIYAIPCPIEYISVTRFGITEICRRTTVLRDLEAMLIKSFKNEYSYKPVLCVQEGKKTKK